MRTSSRVAILSFLILLLFNHNAFADSTSVSFASLSWTDATFSGPLTPTKVDASAYISYGTVEGICCTSIVDGESNVGWIPTTATAQFGLQNYAITGFNSDLTALSAISVPVGAYSVLTAVAQTVVYGSILSTDGNLNISIPYALTISENGVDVNVCCDTSGLGAMIYVSNESGFYDAVSVSYLDQDGAVSAYNSSGVLSLDESGLQPGSYSFYIVGYSDVVFTPEPGTPFLLGTSLLGLAGALLWKRYA